MRVLHLGLILHLKFFSSPFGKVSISKGFILTLLSLVHFYPLVSRTPTRTKLLLEASHFLGVHQFPISMKARQINMKSWAPSLLNWGLVSYYFKLGEKFIGLICTIVRKKLIKLHPMSSTIITTNWFNLGRGREINNLNKWLTRPIFGRYIGLEYP
jgi:hypothetical protein